MIGETYWATGITIDRDSDRRWRVWLEFFDDGFAQSGSTEGVLRLRYREDDLDAAIDTLRADVERLGIRWGPADGETFKPTVYVHGDGEEHLDREALRRTANEQATRLGWEPIYLLATGTYS